MPIDGRRPFGGVGRSKASDTRVDRHHPRGVRYRWTGTDRNRPWELEGEATLLEVDAEVRLYVCVSNLVSQFNGAEDIRTDPCPADTRSQCKCDDFLRKYRRPVAKDRACPRRKAPDRSGFDPNRVVETIFECGAEHGLWILQSFRTDHLDGGKERLDGLLSDDLGSPGPQQGPSLESSDRDKASHQQRFQLVGGRSTGRLVPLILQHVTERTVIRPSGVLEPETECLVLLWPELHRYAVHPLHARNLIGFELTLALLPLVRIQSFVGRRSFSSCCQTEGKRIFFCR